MEDDGVKNKDKEKQVPSQKHGEKTKYPPGRHPNSQKNLALGRIQPGEVRNPYGRPPKSLAWTNIIDLVGDELNETSQKTNRETLIPQGCGNGVTLPKYRLVFGPALRDFAFMEVHHGLST